MGKAKKLRSTSHKKQVPPTGGLSQAELDADSDFDFSMMQADEAEMFRGLVNLQGSIREATCVALATMFGDISDDEQEKKMREKLTKMVDAGLLKKLIPRMVDPLKMVRLHAIGAIRNISVTGGIEICELMTSQNVITPLVKIISESAKAETFEKNDLHLVQVLEQSVALLSNLCESCQAAINELTQGQLLEPIMLIAEKGKAHVSLHLETLKLLLLITESNPRLNEVFGSSAAYQTIIGEIIQSEQLTLLVKLHAVGIAMNVRAIMEAEANVARLLPVIEAALAYDAVNVMQLAQNVSENYELSQKSVLADEDVDDDTITDDDRQQVTNAQIKYRSWRDSVQTLSLALELVADLAVGGDENDDEDEWASDDEDAMEAYAASQMDTEASSSPGLQPATPATKALGASRIFQLTVVILQGLVSIPALHRAIAADFERMRIRVVNAVNNLVQTVSWEALGEDVVPQVFRNLCTLFANVKSENSDKPFDFELSSSTNDIEAATTAAMGSALRRTVAAKKDVAISVGEANLIMTSALQARSVETRMNAIGMIGSVGQRSKNPAEIEVIARCLVSSLNDASLEVVAEALNAVFDVFGDEEFDSIFRSVQLLGALEQTASAVKTKLRAEKKDIDRALAAHVKETHLNLVRFIKYKKKHL